MFSNLGGFTGQDALSESLRILAQNVNSQRKTQAGKILDYYFGSQEQYIEKNPEESEEHWSKRPKVWLNLTYAVTKAVCRLYSNKVKREVNVDWGQEVLKPLTRVMQSVDQFTFLTGTVAVRPVYRDDGSIKYAIYTPDMIDILPAENDPTEPEMVVLSWGQVRGTRVERIAHVWTKDEFIRLRNDKVVERQENPYGRIPLVFFRNSEPLWNFWEVEVPGIQIVKANEILNKLWTELVWTTIFQSHGQLIVKGAPPDFRPVFGPDTYIAIPDSGDVSFIKPDADINKMLDVINALIDSALMSLRIPEGAVRLKTTTTKSGIALVAEQQSLVEWQKLRAEQFRDLEKELVKLALHVYATHQRKSLPQNLEVLVDYPEPKEPLDRDELLEWTFKFNYRVATPIDYILAKNPDLTRDEAEKVYAENVAWFEKNNAVSPVELKALEAKLGQTTTD